MSGHFGVALETLYEIGVAAINVNPQTQAEFFPHIPRIDYHPTNQARELVVGLVPARGESDFAFRRRRHRVSRLSPDTREADRARDHRQARHHQVRLRRTIRS